MHFFCVPFLIQTTIDWCPYRIASRNSREIPGQSRPRTWPTGGLTTRCSSKSSPCRVRTWWQCRARALRNASECRTSLFLLLGVKAFLGSVPSDASTEKRGSDGVAISYDFWLHHFGGGPLRRCHAPPVRRHGVNNGDCGSSFGAQVWNPSFAVLQVFAPFSSTHLSHQRP